MRSLYLICCFIIAALNMRVLALAQNKISSLSLAKDFADSSNNKLSFYENKGQIKNLSDGTVNSDVKFYLQNKDLNVYLLGSGIAYQFNHFIYPNGYNSNIKGLKPDEMEKQLELQSKVKLETYRMDMQLKGANPNAQITTEGRSSDYINYYNHDVLDVHSYSKIIYHDVYPKIDWVIYTNKTGVKYDFVVHPGGDPSMIQLEFEDQEKIHLDEFGNLIIENRLGKITEQKPVSFQNGKEIGTDFNLLVNVLSFNVREYQNGEDLIIDPCVEWSTYYGGTGYDYANSCTSQGAGNAYLSGVSTSVSGIAYGGYQNTFNSGLDAILVKFNSNGNRVWATYYGGIGNDYFLSVVVDSSENIYTCGYTFSSTGIASGGFQNSLGGKNDGFLVKFNSTGQRLWATYYGGGSDDFFYSVAADNAGGVIACGYSNSASGIASNGFQNSIGGSNDGFLVKFNSNGNRVWSSYYGGSLNDYFYSVSLDVYRNIYVCGNTNSTSGIASGGFQNSTGGSIDACLVKFNSAGQRQWATYYGGALNDYFTSLSIDSAGSVYICGNSNSTGLSSSGFQNSISGNDDGILVKFNSSGQRQWATYYGGSGSDNLMSCSIDGMQNIFLTGRTSSTNNIAYRGCQNIFGGGSFDAFIVKFTPLGARIWSTYLGGSGSEFAYSCFASGKGLCYVAGSTNSTFGISKNGFINSFSGGNSDAFMLKFNVCVSSILEDISVCNVYSRKNKNYYNSGIYYDTLRNVFNEDSIIFKVNLTVKKSTIRTIDIVICNRYYFNNKYFYNSGTYFDTLINSFGCDSILILNLTILSSKSSVDISVCKQYYLGKNLIIKSGVYYDTLISYLGCDSIVTLNLRILLASQGNISRSACLRYFWNNKYINNSGVYHDTLVNAVGCDSIVTLNLTVYPEIRRTFNISNCRYYKWNNNYLNQTGIYIDTFNSYRGCDSIVTINLQIKKYAYIYDTLYRANCNPIVWRNIIISNTNVYYDTTLQKLDNCDIVHVLFFTRLPFRITQQPNSKFIYENQTAEFSIASQNPSSKYQWQGNDNNGSNWFSLFDAGPYTGVNTNTLKVKDINAFLDRYAYRCIVSDSNCIEVSNISSLNICPEITQQPVDRYNGLNTHVYFEVKVDFDNVNYQWQIKTGSGFLNLQNDNIFNGVNTGKLDVYIQDIAQKNSQFRCIVSASNCSDTSNGVKLHLLEKTNPNPCNSQSLSSVYPNPTNDYINLLVPSDLIGKEYKIVNENGKELMVGVITKEESKISIKDYAEGIYFLRIGYEGLDCFRIVKLNE